jgi:hypothetical protein
MVVNSARTFYWRCMYTVHVVDVVVVLVLEAAARFVMISLSTHMVWLASIDCLRV